jgi:ABC-type polysaccharide/polyol phosphate export permease
MSAAIITARARHTPQNPWQRHLEIVRLSAVRQLRSRYRGSALGVLWSFANPILMTLIYTAIFGTAFARYYGGSTNRYVASAFVGVVVVTVFLQATADALPSVVANGALLNKIAIDPETFPFAALAANFYQQALTTFPMLIVMAVVLTHDPLRVALVPLVLAGVFLLTAGFALLLSALYVFFRDLSYLWGVVGFIFWLTSPVFYPAELVPAQVRQFLGINPVGLAITALRDVTIDTGPVRFAVIGKFLLVAVVIVVAGHLAFRARRREYMDLL